MRYREFDVEGSGVPADGLLLQRCRRGSGGLAEQHPRHLLHRRRPRRRSGRLSRRYTWTCPSRPRFRHSGGSALRAPTSGDARRHATRESRRGRKCVGQPAIGVFPRVRVGDPANACCPWRSTRWSRSSRRSAPDRSSRDSTRSSGTFRCGPIAPRPSCLAPFDRWPGRLFAGTAGTEFLELRLELVESVVANRRRSLRRCRGIA